VSHVKSSEVVIPIIYRAFVSEQLAKLEEARREDVLYVTDLVVCSHKLRLRHMYPELTVNFDPLAITGSLIHIGVEKYLANQGFTVEYSVEKEFEVDGRKYVLKGRVDAYHPGEGIVVEVKSSKSPQGKPLEHHVLQLQIYLNLLEARQGILVYITPEAFLEYSVEREKLNVKSLIRAVISDEVHPRWSWECKYCVYRRLCPYAPRSGGKS